MLENLAAQRGESLLQVRGLRTDVRTRRGLGRAVDGVSFELSGRETLGLVGESGSGKSLTARSIIGLPPTGSQVGGEVLFRGEDLLKKSPKEMVRYRGKHIAMVLQDPMTALNPLFSIQNQLGESIRLHQGLKGHRLRERAVELLRLMRIPAPEGRLKSYPHEFSGGMRQRVVGAIALSGQPELLIADEPTTALDVTVQAAYLALLKDVQRVRELAILFITHDFGVVAKLCDRVAVMYAGEIVEVASTDAIFEIRAHPYTEALLRSVTDIRHGTKRLVSIEGSPPSIYTRPTGCRFHPRCWLRTKLGKPDRCATESPTLREVRPGHKTACHFAEELLGGPSGTERLV